MGELRMRNKKMSAEKGVGPKNEGLVEVGLTEEEFADLKYKMTLWGSDLFDDVVKYLKEGPNSHGRILQPRSADEKELIKSETEIGSTMLDKDSDKDSGTDERDEYEDKLMSMIARLSPKQKEVLLNSEVLSKLEDRALGIDDMEKEIRDTTLISE